MWRQQTCLDSAFLKVSTILLSSPLLGVQQFITESGTLFCVWCESGFCSMCSVNWGFGSTCSVNRGFCSTCSVNRGFGSTCSVNQGFCSTCSVNWGFGSTCTALSTRQNSEFLTGHPLSTYVLHPSSEANFLRSQLFLNLLPTFLYLSRMKISPLKYSGKVNSETSDI